jgi:zinc transport system substrate-binding protein
MFRFILCLAFTVAIAWPAKAAPKIVVSIVPLHSLVASVMAGVAEPELLLRGVNSEHQASYSPQQILSLAHADMVFMIGDGLEVKLGEISGSDTVNGKAFVKMQTLAGLTTHPIRKGGVWEIEADAIGPVDPHIWLDPENAKVMTQAIASELAKIDRENARYYAANAARSVAELDRLEQDIKTELASERSKPFIVFHDAYQYFEHRFALNAVGSISDYSATPPSAQRLEEIRTKIKSSNAVCVFSEPQFSDAAVSAVTEGSSAKPGVLDPIGAKLTSGKDAYGELLNTLARSLIDCLR